jgi:hypothetical protein
MTSPNVRAFGQLCAAPVPVGYGRLVNFIPSDADCDDRRDD